MQKTNKQTNDSGNSIVELNAKELPLGVWKKWSVNFAYLEN